MGSNAGKIRYKSLDTSLEISGEEFTYPLNAYLGKNLSQGDDIKVILVVKKDPYNRYEQSIVDFEDEIDGVNKTIGAKIEVKKLITDFTEDFKMHHGLLDAIIDEIEENACVMADVTYGNKETPFLAFAALNFAERFLSCDVDRILCSRAGIFDGEEDATAVWDMAPIYYVNSVSNKINCDNPQKARTVLKKILSI